MDYYFLEPAADNNGNFERVASAGGKIRENPDDENTPLSATPFLFTAEPLVGKVELY